MAAVTASLCFALLFAVAFVFVSAEQKTLTADPGQNVTLTCRAPNDKILGVNWIRADLESEYVLLYQDGSFDTDNQHPSFMNRVDLKDRQMKDGDVSVILKNVTINDTGTYECHILMEETRSWSVRNITSLTIVPPEKKNIIVTAEPGENAILPCRSSNNNNNIIFVEWRRPDLGSEYVLYYQHGHFVSDHQHPSFKNRVDLQDRQMKHGDVSVILKNVNTADKGTYKCHIKTGNNLRKRDNLIPDHISIIYLKVLPGPTGGGTREGGGSVGLIAETMKKEDRN
ncbi:matrix remodeling-associated protein 8-like isoform X2 [Archocentrus centrarchus]|uniref:matrix remodeling-associated protein 8-like isoform X2 n=1 Tax=Archocentrus centrarchus TaxID=63155 RepID=UPI0011E9C079|nr:matrix remodeling-associated protein 8-like isoform X2 [Archocentrus centrarchus]